MRRGERPLSYTLQTFDLISMVEKVPNLQEDYLCED